MGYAGFLGPISYICSPSFQYFPESIDIKGNGGRVWINVCLFLGFISLTNYLIRTVLFSCWEKHVQSNR